MTGLMSFLPVIRPTLPALDEIQDLVRQSWESGIMTVGPMVRAFEEATCRQTGARHAVALSSCTAGLMLVPRALDLPQGSEVIVPSFTFAATAQALVWNGLVPVFCDCLPGTCTLGPEDTVVISGLRIGAHAVVGAGSTVLCDVPDGARVAGSPAKLLG